MSPTTLVEKSEMGYPASDSQWTGENQSQRKAIIPLNSDLLNFKRASFLPERVKRLKVNIGGDMGMPFTFLYLRETTSISNDSD